MDALQDQLTGHDSAIYALAFSPDNSLLASGDYGGTIRLWNLSAGQPKRIIRETSSYDYSVWALAFSLDGTLLASGDVAGLRIWDVATASERFVYDLGEVASLAWSPNGKILAVGTDVITLYHGQTGEAFRTINEQIDYGTSVAWNPSGTLLANGSADEGGGIRVWNVQDGALVAILKDVYAKEAGVGFCSDDRIIFTRGYGTLFQWEIETVRVTKLFDTAGAMYETGFSQDGRLVAYGKRGRGIFGADYHMELSVVTEEREPVVLCPDSDEIMKIAFSSDNTMLAISDGADLIRVWNVSQLLQ